MTLRCNDVRVFPSVSHISLSLSLRAVAGGVVDAGPAYQKNLSEEMTKLQRLYGGGDLTKFPQFNFPGEPDEDLL